MLRTNRAWSVANMALRMMLHLTEGGQGTVVLKIWNPLGMAIPCNPSTQEAKTGLHKFKTSLGYLVSSGPPRDT